MNTLNVKFITNQAEAAKSIQSLLEPSSFFKEEASKIIFAEHPELKNIDISDKKALLNYVESVFSAHSDDIKSAIDIYTKEWKKVEANIGVCLSEILNTKLEGFDKVIGNIGIIQIYPRDLQEKTFDLYYKEYPYYAIATALHEVTHFFYAKKWLELFPNDKIEYLEAPHAFWHLSEIMVPIINSEESLRRLIPDADIKSYNDYDIPYNKDPTNTSIYGFFVKNYFEYKNKGKTIEEFLKFSRGIIEKLF